MLIMHVHVFLKFCIVREWYAYGLLDIPSVRTNLTGVQWKEYEQIHIADHTDFTVNKLGFR